MIVHKYIDIDRFCADKSIGLYDMAKLNYPGLSGVNGYKARYEGGRISITTYNFLSEKHGDMTSFEITAKEAAFKKKQLEKEKSARKKKREKNNK